MMKIETSSFIPIYEQVRNEVKRRIALGFLRPDELLPSIRDLAAGLVINPNTVARAYRELEQEGLIYTRKGKGCFVAAVPHPPAEEERLRQLGQLFAKTIEDAVRLGSDPAEMRRVFEERLGRHGLSD